MAINVQGGAQTCDEHALNTRRWPSRSSSERLGQPHFWSPMPPAVLVVTAEGASCAVRAVPSEGMQTTWTARCFPALIASRMVFRHRARARHRGLDKSDQRAKSVSFGRPGVDLL